MLRRLLNAWRGRRALADLDEEIETHRRMVERRLRESGSSAADAIAESRRRLGNTTLAREDARRVWIASWLDAASQDVRYALRNLFGAPAFAILVLVTLGIGIAVNTSLLTVFSALFL